MAELSDIWTDIINCYIRFYRSEIRNEGLFDGIDGELTNTQLDILRSEVEKFKDSDEEFKSLCYDINNLKKYVICVNSKQICSSDSLLAILIENVNLKNENKEIVYDVKFRNSFS